MMSRGRRDEVVQICGDDCRYRKLYEGSQRSLTEMAARQAQAVSRVGRLRTQLVLAAKRAFPKAFGEAERDLGKRMSEVTDEILVAYLESFMGSSILAEEPEGASDLRQALGELGIPIPAGVDLKDWAAAVRRYGTTAIEQTPVLPPMRTTGSVAQSGDGRPVPNRSLSAAPERVSRPIDDDLDLLDLFNDDLATEDLANDGRGGEVADNSSNGGGTGRSPGRDASDDGGESVETPPSVPTVAVSPARLDDESETIEVVSGDMLAEAMEDAADELFGGDAIITGSDGGIDEDAEFFFEDVAPAVNDGGDASSADPLPETSVPAEGEPAPTENHPPAEESAKPALPSWASGRTVKPQLFPSGGVAPRSGKRERKPIRSRAIPADVPDVPITNRGQASGVLTDEIRQRLLAAAGVARPVFTSDLETAIGSADLVSLWRDEAQDSDLSVRFVLPKPRHRLRGSLVIPQAALAGASSDYARSHWARCMESYRGARIYELGVFFHRFLEQVISFESDGDVVAVRMSLPSGLTGAVLVAGQDLAPGGSTRTSLCTALERLLQDRLVHVAVLVLNAEQFDATLSAIEQEARERHWLANMPVTLSRSWEYVDGTGTAIPLLGV